MDAMKRILVLAGVVFLVPYMIASPPQSPSGGIQMQEAKLGKDVKDRQLEGETAEFALNDKVYVWVKTTGASGESLVVTWKNGDHTYTSNMTVGGSPWRTWCYKIAALPGNWTVSIADSKGTVLKELSFKTGN
jgi:hypothetical protein